MTIALITGDREWTDDALIHAALATLRPEVIIEGECRGADLIARHAAERFDIEYDPRPADWDLYGRAAGPIRNQEMLDLRPDVCLAFHDDLDGRSRGTKDMVARCLRAKIPVCLFTHDQPEGRWL